MYKVGDKVKARSHIGKVVYIHFDWITNTIEYDVEFDDENLIPPVMRFKESDINKINEQKYFWTDHTESIWDLDEMNKNLSLPDIPLDVNNETHCPKCGSEWHKDKYHGQWRDCLKCGKRREDLI